MTGAARAGGGYGLRLWENDDLVPRPDDVFQERLYCVRWRLPALDTLLWGEQHAREARATGEDDAGWASALPDGVPPPIPARVDLKRAISVLVEILRPQERREVSALRRRDWLAEDRALEEARRTFETLRAANAPTAQRDAAAERFRTLRESTERRNDRSDALAKLLPGMVYRAVDEADLEREARVLALLRERLAEWQARGYVPSRKIAPGAKTDEPIRTRGWTYWHHLFTPRQLLTIGLIASEASTRLLDKEGAVVSTRVRSAQTDASWWVNMTTWKPLSGMWSARFR